MSTSMEPAWSEDVEQAAWIGPRLMPFDVFEVASVVPCGFEAYARVLHPAATPGYEDHLVRWAEVAAWSGLPLRRDAQFHSVALPPTCPSGDVPGPSQGPREGSLYPPDAEVLAEILRPWTATPERCWFCVWEGYGWEGRQLNAPAGEPSVMLPDLIPEAVRRGPRVRLPNRDYLLHVGPVEAVVATVDIADDQQVANLWWPQDRAWCVASEIDLPWTYVGGPAGLIERLLADERIEALPAESGDPLSRWEDWVTSWSETAATELLSTGSATITTCRGTVRASLRRPVGYRSGHLITESVTASGFAGGEYKIGANNEEILRRDLSRHLSQAVVDLVGG